MPGDRFRRRIAQQVGGVVSHLDRYVGAGQPVDIPDQIAPRIILSVGRVSAHNLLGTSEPVGKLIRDIHRLPGTDIPVKVTYHPAYLLRYPSAKAVAWQDL